MFYIDPFYLLCVFVPTIIISLAVQLYLRSTYNKWGKIANHNNLTGKQVAGVLFSKTSLDAIPVQSVRGELSDHFDPKNNVVRLSQSTGDRNSVSAMAVTAHELGHVQQYQNGSALIKIRGILMPALQFSPTISYIAILLGLWFNMTNLLWVGIFFFAIMVLFSIFTLPVEFDASRRAVKLLTEAGLMNDPDDAKGSRQMLTAAGLTYLASAVTSILQLLYYVSIAQRRR
jgi:Zn-dependent membrane protease YugP